MVVRDIVEFVVSDDRGTWYYLKFIKKGRGSLNVWQGELLKLNTLEPGFEIIYVGEQRAAYLHVDSLMTPGKVISGRIISYKLQKGDRVFFTGRIIKRFKV